MKLALVSSLMLIAQLSWAALPNPEMQVMCNFEGGRSWEFRRDTFSMVVKEPGDIVGALKSDDIQMMDSDGDDGFNHLQISSAKLGINLTLIRDFKGFEPMSGLKYPYSIYMADGTKNIDGGCETERFRVK